jgi:hypothetical protein
MPCQYSYLSIFDYCAPVQRRFLKDGLVSDACWTWGLHVSTRNPIPHGEFYLCANLPVSPVKRFDLWMVQNHAKRHPPESHRRRGGHRSTCRWSWLYAAHEGRDACEGSVLGR